VASDPDVEAASSRQHYTKNSWLDQVTKPPPVDLGSEDWEFPDASDLTPDEAAVLWDRIEHEASAANKRASRLKERKAVAKDLALRKIQESPYSFVGIELANGREIQVKPYEWEVFDVVDETAFQAWAREYADAGGEHYYDPEPQLRRGIFLDDMRRRSQDGEPLPPGVRRYSETKISRTLLPQRRKPKAVAPAPEA
jgi:hypothetical protein